ncbi:lipopolysaccharide biosynthesis protein [Pseudomonas proteolytica]|uniref:lipopolysaccharide biosynthesis protein n=1 Tax=Pseudomonas proteolytica TaxID=219574 RepID=UPI001473F289|nr:oligosaccharide flippase family protein [Pseudomonas proteolytica]NMY95207.1 oligosaccharide flippase family protein [Pseudomonas proteolytica]
MSRKLLGKAGIFLFANIINAAIPFLLLPVLTRVLTPADYGVVAMFSIMVSIFGALTGLSVHGAIGVRYFELDRDSLARYIGSCVAILGFSTTLVLLVVAVFGDRLVEITNVPYSWLLTAVVVSGLQFVINIKLTLWQVGQEARRYGVFQVSQGLINSLCSLMFIFVFYMAWEGRLLGQVIATATFGLLALFLLFKSRELDCSAGERSYYVDALKFGVPLVPHVIGGLAMVVADRFIVGSLLDLEAVGIYTLALQFGMAMGLIADAFSKVYSPWLYRKLKESTCDAQLQVVGVTYLSWLFFIILALAANLFCYLFFLKVVGAEFYRAQEIIFWFFLGQTFKGMYLTVTGFFFFSSHTGKLSFITLATGIISIFASLWFVSNYGLEGAAIAYAISEFVLFFFVWVFSRLIHPMPWFSLYPSLRVILNKVRAS